MHASVEIQNNAIAKYQHPSLNAELGLQRKKLDQDLIILIML